MAARTRRSSRARSPLRFVALPLIIVILGALIWHLARGRDRRSGGEAVDFGERLVALAAVHGATAADIEADQRIRKVAGVFVRSWRIRLPDASSAEAMITDLTAEAVGWGGAVHEEAAGDGETARMRIDLGVEAFDLSLVVPRQVARVSEPTPAPTPRPSPMIRPSPRPDSRGRLAVILDDGGQSMDLVRAVCALPEPVAVSVLPFLPFSAETAAALNRSGHEVWLHLPMEARGSPPSNPGPGAITVGMSEDEIRTGVHTALNSVPHVVGVNNHMGSRATADLRVMTWVMQELKARGVAFVDSRTTVDTVAETAARAQGVPTNRRHVFLDNTATRRAVQRQLEEAVYRCRTEGEIIAIGHMTNRVTVEVLEEELPGLARRGADLVPPSELTR